MIRNRVDFPAPFGPSRAVTPASTPNVTSLTALHPKTFAPVYSATKAGLRSFTRGLRLQAEPFGIHVMEAIPPLVDTAMTSGRGKGKISAEDKDAILGRIKITADLKDMADADFVVEAATENETLKFKVFQDLDGICKPGVILATNTSSIPIGRIAAQTGRPEKVVGMHFMNPVPVMKLVEVIRGLATSDETYQTTWDLSLKFGKTPALAALVYVVFTRLAGGWSDRSGRGALCVGGSLLLVSQAGKAFYAVLFLDAAYWAWMGHWLYTWDQLLWILGFWAIEFNLKEWRESNEAEAQKAEPAHAGLVPKGLATSRGWAACG